MTTKPSIVWLRDDLRLDDQPAIAAAAGAPALFIYVFDEESRGLRPLGGASKWWLAHSLRALSESLAAIGGRLDILRGAGAEVVPAVAEAAGTSAVFWTRRYGGAEIDIDKSVKAKLIDRGRDARSFNGQLLREPWDVVSSAGTPFRVFTPYWRQSRALGRETRRPGSSSPTSA
jgi:deoxyribodipyrimidine photo-lyase